MNNSEMSKMYILIRDSVDIGHAVLGAAHASLGGYLDFTNLDKRPCEEVVEVHQWVNNSFRKVVCKVTDDEFDRAIVVAKKEGLVYRAMQECALGDGDISLVFAPRDEWPKFFKYLRLWRGGDDSGGITVPEPPNGYTMIGWGRIRDKENELILDAMGKWVAPGCRGGYYVRAKPVAK